MLKFGPGSAPHSPQLPTPVSSWVPAPAATARRPAPSPAPQTGPSRRLGWVALCGPVWRGLPRAPEDAQRPPFLYPRHATPHPTFPPTLSCGSRAPRHRRTPQRSSAVRTHQPGSRTLCHPVPSEVSPRQVGRCTNGNLGRSSRPPAAPRQNEAPCSRPRGALGRLPPTHTDRKWPYSRARVGRSGSRGVSNAPGSPPLRWSRPSPQPPAPGPPCTWLQEAPGPCTELGFGPGRPPWALPPNTASRALPRPPGPGGGARAPAAVTRCLQLRKGRGISRSTMRTRPPVTDTPKPPAPPPKRKGPPRLSKGTRCGLEGQLALRQAL